MSFRASFQYRDLAVSVVPGPRMDLDCYPDTMRNPPAPPVKKPPGPPKGPKPGKPPGAPEPVPGGEPPKPAGAPRKPGKPARSEREGLELLRGQLRRALVST